MNIGVASVAVNPFTLGCLTKRGARGCPLRSPGRLGAQVMRLENCTVVARAR